MNDSDLAASVAAPEAAKLPEALPACYRTALTALRAATDTYATLLLEVQATPVQDRTLTQEEDVEAAYARFDHAMHEFSLLAAEGAAAYPGPEARLVASYLSYRLRIFQASKAERHLYLAERQRALQELIPLMSVVRAYRDNAMPEPDAAAIQLAYLRAGAVTAVSAP